MTPGATSVPTVPGYRTGRLLGFGATGEVWAAVAEEDGEPVALKVLHASEADADRMLRESAVLRRVDHPHVVRLRTVVTVPGCGPVLVLDRALGGSLSALVGARGPLDVGEVVTVLTPLAGALADLHERGLVHGDVTPGNVLFDDRGRPLLGDLGVASIVGEGAGDSVHGTPGYADPARGAGDPATPAADVHGLAATGWLALTGHAPRPAGERVPLVALVPAVPPELAALLDEALDVDPARRPSARELASRCFDSAPAAPVRLVPTDPAAAPAEVVTHRLRAAAAASPGVVPAGPGRHRLWRPGTPSRYRPLVVAACGVVAAAGVVAGALWVSGMVDDALPGQAPAAAPAPVATAEVTPAEIPVAIDSALRGDDPLAAVPALAWLRARAFTTGDTRLLERAGAPRGAALEQDLESLARLREAGVLLQGLGFDVRSTELVSRNGDRAVVEVTVVALEHRQVDAGGATVTDVPRAPERVSRLELVRGETGWQVVSAAQPS